MGNWEKQKEWLESLSKEDLVKIISTASQIATRKNQEELNISRYKEYLNVFARIYVYQPKDLILFGKIKSIRLSPAKDLYVGILDGWVVDLDAAELKRVECYQFTWPVKKKLDFTESNRQDLQDCFAEYASSFASSILWEME